LDIKHAVEQLIQRLLLHWLGAGELFHPAEMVPHRLIIPIPARKADDVEILWEAILKLQLVERWHEFAVRQITGNAKYDEPDCHR
jgi:hypothetical protein